MENKMEMNYKNIIEIVRKKLENAHNPKISKIRTKFFTKEYNFFKNHIKNKNVLVAGSGLGHDSIALAKHNKKVVGIELIKQYIEIANYRSKILGLKNIYFERGDFRKLKYPNKSFDIAVLNMGTIGDFKNKKEVLNELLRVAKKVYFDFYPPTENGLNKRKKMYEEEGWNNVQIKNYALVSKDGLYSKSISKEEINKVVKDIKAKAKCYNFCDFSTMAEVMKC